MFEPSLHARTAGRERRSVVGAVVVPLALSHLHVVRHRTERDNDNDASDARKHTTVDRPIRDLVEELRTVEHSLDLMNP